ncbi:MAG: RNA-dependent DNA polymerase [Candidatus Moranbacteria bacterium]|nr:RNA-dependent DNA polymerase [Candidatus Moranbacteria bacterium]
MFKYICEIEPLLRAYTKARQGKKEQGFVCAFDYNLEYELGRLKYLLESGRYRPAPYTRFMVFEPKTRQVSAPAFQDRVVQHSLVGAIGPIFEKRFILDSYACRVGKGTHFGAKRVKRFLSSARSMYGRESEMYVLQCDVQKYFQSISWDTLLSIVEKRIRCGKTRDLVRKIITTHDTAKPHLTATSVSGQGTLFQDVEAHETPAVSVELRKGLPIGNLTSQLFANIYLDILDHFVKETLREKWYARYMDDFLIIHPDKAHLRHVRDEIGEFLYRELGLELHPKKTIIRNVREGIPFVGYRIFYDHMMVRGSTLIRMRRKYRKTVKLARKDMVSEESLKRTQSSIRGHLKHATAKHLTERIFREREVKK